MSRATHLRRCAAHLTPQHDGLLPFTREVIEIAFARGLAGKAIPRNAVTAQKAAAKTSVAKTGVAKRAAAKKATRTRATAAKKAGMKKPAAGKTPQSKFVAKSRRGKGG